MTISLVVGGSRGIGLEVAKVFRERGDTTFVLSRNARDWTGDHIPADLADKQSLSRAIQQLRDRSIEIRYLVFAQKNRSENTAPETEMMISVLSVMYTMEQILPLMAKQAAVVFIGSPAGKFIVSEQPAAYHVAKAGLEQYARHCAVTYGMKGITFNCVLPGTIIKESNRDFFNSNPDVSNLLKKITPLGILGEARDVANAIAFFCSENARFVTGQTLFLDGGQGLQGQESVARMLANMEQ